MKGLELARKYWEELGRPAFEKECPQVLEKAPDAIKEDID